MTSEAVGGTYSLRPDIYSFEKKAIPTKSTAQITMVHINFFIKTPPLAIILKIWIL